MTELIAIRWNKEAPGLSILNQLLLPHKSECIDIKTCEDAHLAITSMQTRGAPAIAIVAALSLAVELSHQDISGKPAQDIATYIHGRLDYLGTSRPTAVNLFEAIHRLKHQTDISVAKVQGESNGGSVVVQEYVRAAQDMLLKDVADNEAIGRWGSQFIQSRSGGKICVLTHCNTGALATAGHGTALGVVRSLWKDQGLERVYFTETRPYNQGSRLTAYELQAEGIPSTLVCDSAVAALLQRGETKAVVVGADRVARNGDTANKVGTLQLALVAKHFGVDFIVAAPSTSVDLETESGGDIEVEMRSGEEITSTAGFTGELEKVRVQVAPQGTEAWNPSFDVTPASLITAIVTERGVMEKNLKGEFEFLDM